MNGKKKPRGKPFVKGYDERRNLLGAPLRGDSYAEHFDKSVQMTPAQVVELIGKDNDLGQAFCNMPQDVPLKMLLSLRNIAAEMFEPSAGRMAMMMERTEGKVTDHLDLSNSDGTLQPKENDDERFNRAISSLADALRESVSSKSTGEKSPLDTGKPPAVAGVFE